jgi:hypothetical protein
VIGRPSRHYHNRRYHRGRHYHHRRHRY